MDQKFYSCPGCGAEVVGRFLLCSRCCQLLGLEMSGQRPNSGSPMPCMNLVGMGVTSDHSNYKNAFVAFGIMIILVSNADMLPKTKFQSCHICHCTSVSS